MVIKILIVEIKYLSLIEIIYDAKFWQEKILVNLAIGFQFTKIFPTTYWLMYEIWYQHSPIYYPPNSYFE